MTDVPPKLQRRRNLLGVVAAIGVGAAGFLLTRNVACTDRSGTPTPTGKSTRLMLFCGAGVRVAADALTDAFRRETGIVVETTYAGSDRLMGQISASGRGDLFMPGSEFYVNKAIELGLAEPGSQRVVAYFVPVIFVRKGNPKAVQSLNGLAGRGLRVGIGDERVTAVGQQTLEVLRKNGIAYETIERNVVLKAGTVTELGEAVRLGSIDAAIVWDATADQFADGGDVVPIPPAKNVPAAIPVVLLKSSTAPEAARRFIDFAASQQGKRILSEMGYTVTLGSEFNASHE